MTVTKTDQNSVKASKIGPFQFKTEPEYVYSIAIIIGYFITIYGLFTFPYSLAKKTILWNFAIGLFAKFGETAGVHRLWSHRSYKAKLPLRIFLLLCYYLTFWYRAIDWIKFHRVHHKYTDTDADPHNTKRGFFYSHVGWIMLKKHPEVKRRIKEHDFSDIYNDPVLTIGEKYFIPLGLTLSIIIPTLVPVYYWNETWKTALWAVFLRYSIGANVTGTINSFAHFYGSKPYDRDITSAENRILSIITLGEGWHNYHHVFPFDYKAGELPIYPFNMTTLFLDMFAKIGWAYDLKTASTEMIQKRVKRTGDGTHHLWGWGDQDQLPEEKEQVIITHQSNH